MYFEKANESNVDCWPVFDLETKKIHFYSQFDKSGNAGGIEVSKDIVTSKITKDQVQYCSNISVFDQIDCLERPEDCMYDLNLNSSKTAQYISDNFVIDKTGDKEKDLIMCDEASFTKTIQKQDQHEYLFIPNDLVYARMAEVLMQDKELKRYLDYTKKTNVSMSQNAINNTKVYYSLDFAEDDLRFFSDINNGQMSYHAVLEDHIQKEGAEFAHI